jgi:hypothetical protein
MAFTFSPVVQSNDVWQPAQAHDPLVADRGYDVIGPQPALAAVEVGEVEAVVTGVHAALSGPRTSAAYTRGIKTPRYARGVSQLFQARVGDGTAEERRHQLEQGLSSLQAPFAQLDEAERAAIAELISALKQEIGQNGAKELADDPERRARDGAAMEAGAALGDYRDLPMKLSEAFGQLDKAMAYAQIPGGDAIAAEMELRKLAPETVVFPTAEGPKSIALRGIADVAPMISAAGAWAKYQEEKDASLAGLDEAARSKHQLEQWAAVGTAVQGAMQTLVIGASHIARFKDPGLADKLYYGSRGLFAAGGKAIKSIGAVAGIFTLLSDTASAQDKADAVEGWVELAVEVGGGMAEGAVASGSTSAATAAVAQWAGPVGLAIGTSWAMAKWIGAEVDQANHGLMSAWLGGAYRAMRSHMTRMSEEAATVAAVADRLADEQDPDYQRGVYEMWVDETEGLASSVRAFLSTCEPDHHTANPGSYLTLRNRFASLVASHGETGAGTDAVISATACMQAMHSAFADQQDVLTLETGGKVAPKSKPATAATLDAAEAYAA